MQHKKRGRPRLRDDRESRFDTAKYAQPDESLSRRSSLYSSATSSVASYDDQLRRAQSYRTIKSQPNGIDTSDFHSAPRSTFPRPPIQQLRPDNSDQDAVAYLTLDLSIISASEPFFEMLGSRDVLGRRLVEIVSAHERERLSALQSSLQAEQTHREPNYLPPIYLREETDRLVRSLPLSGDVLARYRLDRIETITFMMANGQLRPALTRIGMAKEGSIYFVVLRPELPSHRVPSVPDPYVPRSLMPPVASSSRPPPGTFDNRREPAGHHTPKHPYGASGLSMAPVGHGRSDSRSARPYPEPSSARTDAQASIPGHIPRNEAVTQRPQPHEFQLPPIRMTPQMPSQNPPRWQKDERSGRVDIGRILDGPSTARREG